MRPSLVVAALRLAALSLALAWLAAPAPALAEGDAKARLDEIMTGLQGNAVLWRQDKPVEPAPEIALKSFTFDANTAPLLVAVLQTNKTDPNSLYVTARLLRQLTFARTAVIRSVLPAVKAFRDKAKVYEPMPTLTDAQVKALQKPTDSSPKAQEALEQRRAEKVAKEKAIAKRNEAKYAIERQTFHLMLQAQSIEEDKVITTTLMEAEKKGTDQFLTLLEALGSDARLMSQQRAQAIFDTLRPQAIEIKMEPKKSYVNYGKATIREDDRSTFETRSEYPGIAMMRVMNRISTAAKSPALKVPTEKEIAKYRADPRGKPTPLPPRKDRTKG